MDSAGFGGSNLCVATGQGTSLSEIAEQLRPTLEQIRRQIHQNPEVGFKEFQTQKTILQFLFDHGIEQEAIKV